MSDDWKQLEKIQQRIKELSQKKLDLMEIHRPNANSYERRAEGHEQQKTLYQRLSGKPSLQPDQELQAIISEIARLETEEEDCFKLIQAAASIPPPVQKKDWSKSRFYSHTLMSLNYDYPPDQMGFYLTTLTGIAIVSKGYWKSWNIKKAAEMLDKGVVESEMLSFHRHFSGLNNEQLKDARMIGLLVKLKAFAVAGLLIGGFTIFVQLKNKNRFNK